jgi:dienelactone hydrolase
VHTADIEYTHDGLRLVGRIAFDDSHPGKRPAVLISHDAGGLDDLARHSARRLAELGYVAFALDYHGGGVRLPPEQLGERFGRLAGDPPRIRDLARAGLEVLLANDFADAGRVAAIGYCFGGTMALELARSGADLKAVVGFHSGLSTQRPEDAANITGKVLVCIGADDPIIPPEQRLAFEEEMRAGGVDWQLHLHGGAVHSFTNPVADGSNPAIKYDRAADERSWRAMLDLFTEVFSSAPTGAAD